MSVCVCPSSCVHARLCARLCVCACACACVSACARASKQAVKRLHKERKRFLEKISLNEEQRDEAKEELNLTAGVHDDTKTRLETQEQLTFREEQRTRVSPSATLRGLAVAGRKEGPLANPCVFLFTEGHRRAEETADGRDERPRRSEGESDISKSEARLGVTTLGRSSGGAGERD